MSGSYEMPWAERLLWGNSDSNQANESFLPFTFLPIHLVVSLSSGGLVAISCDRELGLLWWGKQDVDRLWYLFFMLRKHHLKGTDSTNKDLTDQTSIKGVVQPVIIYSPSCSSKPVWLSLFCESQNNFLLLLLLWYPKFWFWGPLTSIVWTKNTETFLKIYFIFHRRKNCKKWYVDLT